MHITWSFLLTPEKECDGTRLVLRYRGLLQPRLAHVPFYGFLDVAEFMMSRKMLLGIKRSDGGTGGERQMVDPARGATLG
jgi:hypothetical protein